MLQNSPQSLRGEVLQFLEQNDWKGRDPFDGLCSPFSKIFFGKLGRLFLLQAVKRSPVDLRSLLRIDPRENAMTRAVGALGLIAALRRGEEEREALLSETISAMLRLEDPETGLWGYPFPWQARAFYLPTNRPNLVISSVCLRALSEWMKLGLKTGQPVEVYQELYRKKLDALIRVFYKPEDGFFSYVGHDAVLVHNANLFGAEAIFATEGVGLSQNQIELGITAVQKTLSFQEASGRWAYGTEHHHGWADNYHSAYNLVSLAKIHRSGSKMGLNSEFLESIRAAAVKGLQYYLDHGFDRNYSARYYDNNTWPVETHSSAAALICLKEVVDAGWMPSGAAKDLSDRVLKAALHDTYLGRGAFAYRKWRFFKIGTVFTRWTQAWMYYGLESKLSLDSETSRVRETK